MAQAFKADYIGQMVKVTWPCLDKTLDPSRANVYGFGAAWVTFDNKGDLSGARQATDEEIRWWMSLQASEDLRAQIGDLQNTLINQFQNR